MILIVNDNLVAQCSTCISVYHVYCIYHQIMLRNLCICYKESIIKAVSKLISTVFRYKTCHLLFIKIKHIKLITLVSPKTAYNIYYLTLMS